MNEVVFREALVANEAVSAVVCIMSRLMLALTYCILVIHVTMLVTQLD